MIRTPLRHGTAVALACAALFAIPGAHAQDNAESMFSFAGFGTLAATHATEKRADFVGTVYQPNGTGRTSDWDFNPDSRLGAQVTGKFTKDLTGVVQVIAQHRFDNSHTPAIEWANLKYQFSPAFSVRAGRIALPTFLVSESRFVGYAQPWVRPPSEVYFLGSITSSDGVDATYRTQLGSVSHAVQAFWGKNAPKLPNGTEIKSDPSWGFNDTMEFGDTTVRLGYLNNSLDLNTPQLNPLFTNLAGIAAGGLSMFGSSYAVDAQRLLDKYSTQGLKLQTFSLGANHDAGNWFVMGEFAHFKGDGFLSDANSLYATFGYRINKFTPYVTYAQTKADITEEAGINTAGLPGMVAGGIAQLNGGINTTLYQFTATQKTRSIGTRWDVAKNTAVKLQYDHTTLGANSKGRLTNADPTRPNGGKFEVFTVAVDFLF